jgi:protein-S-isoprenylcysteine O-methyltransferase Ste14
LTWLETRIPPPVVLAAFAAATWGLDQLGMFDVGSNAQSLRWAALPLAAVGLCLEIVAVAGFFRARTTISPLAPAKSSALVTGGLYRFTRNPMYLGMAILLAAWSIWLVQPLGVAAIAGFVAYITRFQILPEERALAARFGAEFDAFQARTRRWL